MVADSSSQLQVQVDRLNRRLRRLQLVLVLMAFSAIGILLVEGIFAQGPTTLRARSLIIEDEAGKARVILGAPVPGPQRISPSTGMIILDKNGVERFGVGLLDNGNMAMGFDAPPGTGDPRNRERINLVADANGSAWIRFLNRQTRVPARLLLDERDQFYLEFLDFGNGKVTSKRISFAGEQTSELP
jgi:hypothetical protein